MQTFTIRIDKCDDDGNTLDTDTQTITADTPQKAAALAFLRTRLTFSGELSRYSHIDSDGNATEIRGNH